MSDSHAGVLVRRMKAILEPAIRAAVMAELLETLAASEAVAILVELTRVGAEPGPAVVMTAVATALGLPERIPYDQRAALHAAAIACDHPEIARLFFDASPARAEELALQKQLSQPRPLVPRGRPLTLGERKALARGHRREALRPLLSDPHPDVVDILVDNPHVIESDVLAIAARRPVLGPVLERIALHPRWGPRLRVRRAVLYNPAVPRPLAVRLMASLPDGELAELAAQSSLDPILRQHAGELLRQRRGG